LDKENTPDIGLRIEKLIQGDLQIVVRFNCKKFRQITRSVLGYNSEDMMQVIRLSIWKALLTFDDTKGAMLSTYASTIITRDFIKLLRKNRPVLIPVGFAVQYHNKSVDPESEERWKGIFREFLLMTNELTEIEKQVLDLHIKGFNSVEIDERVDVPKHRIFEIIKSIKTKMMVLKEK